MLATITQNSVKIAVRRTSKKVDEKSLENLKDNTTKSLSTAATRRLKKCISNLIDAETLGRFGPDWKKHKRKINLNFVTLTLPSVQKHTDKEVKKMLNYYLTELKKMVGEFSYVWKAEKQKNGNIHFHILINKYINYSYIRKVWNNILNRNGYIEEYRKKLSSMTLNEYIEHRKKDAKIKHTKEHIKEYTKAYMKGKKTNWTNPNTTDIHTLKGIKSASAYISKYMSKDEKGVEGRYWGASDELRNYEFVVPLNKNDANILLCYSSKICESKYYCVFYFTDVEILRMLSFFYQFLTYVQTYYCLINKRLYNVEFMKRYNKRT